MGLVDFTNPAARAWFAGKLRTLLDQGVDCFKTDFGERIPVDVEWHDGSETVFELLREVRGDGDAVVFARSATVGGQRLPVHWGGDCESTFEAMAESLRGGLSLSMSGFGFWSHDIGGFEGTPTPEAFKRWVQFGLLSSHSRLHGSKSYRVPWDYDEEAPAEGAEYVTEVPSPDGSGPSAIFTTRRNGAEIVIESTSDKPWNVLLVGANHVGKGAPHPLGALFTCPAGTRRARRRL
jgi:alpha-glucosidase (family GH31 glycosyl hydrolase)